MADIPLLRRVAFDVCVESFSGYCSLCSSSTPEPSALRSYPISIMPGESTLGHLSLYHGKAFHSIPPITEESFWIELETTGWKRELLHGKTLLICPSCAAKNGKEVQA